MKYVWMKVQVDIILNEKVCVYIISYTYQVIFSM